MPLPTDSWWQTFITERPRTAKVATVRADGRPHIAPVWVALDGNDVVFITSGASIKAQAMTGDQRVALCMDEDQLPVSYVLVEGTAETDTDPDTVLEWATIIGGRYMGSARAEEVGRAMAA